ncbi:MAG: hypothetical protein KIH65_004265 [Candidatus Uhrbacteria bacterium]|nr:hypothetical protein [Candidatus Uhrbacteria bacterium]
MEQRIERILTHLIEDYLRSAEPISSQGLVREHQLDVSSATIRNWFALLEEEGYLIQPHTSAGRIPSELAWRWYVERLGDGAISESEHDVLQVVAKDASDSTDRVKRIAKACAGMTKLAALVGTNRSDTYYTGLTDLFCQPEFKDWSRVISMTSMFDRMDHQLDELRRRTYPEPVILLGSTCPFGNACGSLLLTTSNGDLLALLGPIRMDYQKAKTIMNVVKHML